MLYFSHGNLDFRKDGIVSDFVSFLGSDAAAQILHHSNVKPFPRENLITFTNEQNAYVTSSPDRRIANLQFSFGSPVPADADCKEAAKAIKTRNAASFEIISFTDDIGGDRANIRLSRDRAVAVQSCLTQQGIQQNGVKVDGLGRLPAGNDASMQARNRRVDIFEAGQLSVKWRRLAYGHGNQTKYEVWAFA